MIDRLIVVPGIVVLLAIAWIASTDRKHIRPFVVARALLLQASIGAIALLLPQGRAIMNGLSDGVLAVIGTSTAGIDMVFGDLAANESGFVFAVRVLPVIIFFSSLMAVLYHLRLMQLAIRVIGGGLQTVIGVSRLEALNAAANVFVGLTEAPLAIKPFLAGLSKPQFFCVMTSGVASVAGSVLAAYVLLGVRLDFLLAASFMAAPGGLAMAKMVMPDGTDSPELDSAEPLREDLDTTDDQRESNVVLAAASGAADGLRLAVNIGAMLIAFVSLIALVNLTLGVVTTWFGGDGVTLEKILGAAFSPLMFLLGVPWTEASIAGALFGEKLVLNEFVAYLHFADLIGTLTPRTEAVITFSLCGFANISAIAVLLGGIGVLAPNHRELIGRQGLRVVLAGSLSNLMSAAIVSLLIGGGAL